MSHRIYAEPAQHQAHFHVYSRCAGGDFLFGDEEREHFRRLMTRLLQFCGLEAVSWCCMSNHFHILLTVPGEERAAELREKISEEQLFQRMKIAFSDQYISEVQWRVKHAREEMKNEAWAQDILNRLKTQMFDLSKFMQMLKRRFSAWHNKKHGRRGTLWEERFGSVLIEDSEDALRTMATYIDLNPVRAGMVDDPKDYRWCGYAEAVGGSQRARHAIQQLLADKFDLELDWRKAARLYRCWLFEGGARREDRQGRTVRKGLNREQIEKVWAEGGRLSRRELLHCRVRYLTKGVAIGSKAFVEGVFEHNRARFSPNRKCGARPMRYGELSGMCSLRDLKVEVIQPPGMESIERRAKL
jgi:putative transposase